MKARRTPFAMVPLWVYDHDDVTPTVLQVYIALAALAHGSSARRSVAEVMERCGLKKSAVYGSLAVLERIKAVVREGRDSWFLPLDHAEVDSATTETDSVAADDPSVTTDADSAATESRLFSIETTSRPKTTTRATTDVEAFDQFWSTYPKRADKGAARRAWATAIKRATPEAIIAGAERYRDDPNRDEAYTKNPATWLNAEAWDNPPLPPRGTNGKAPSGPRMTRDAAEEERRRSLPSGRVTDL